MARQVERDGLISIANGINQDVEALAGYLNEVKALETAFAESWNDTDPASKADDCAANIQAIELLVANSMALSQGVATLYINDTKTGGVS